jgi:hypothetical protein
MTHEPVRLLHDSAAGAALRRDLGAVARVDVGYDVAAGLARFEGSLASGAGAARAGGISGGALAGAALLLAGGLTAALLVWLPGATPEVRAPADALIAPVDPPAPVPTRVVTPSAEPPAEILVDDEAPASPPLTAKTTKRPVRAAKVHPATEPGATKPSADYLREARSLQAARSLLGRDPAGALAQAEAGAGEFTGGTFAQEWEGVAILALFELGRPEARARGEAFLRTYPSGTYAPRVRVALSAP